MTHSTKKNFRKDGSYFWTTYCGLHVSPEFNDQKTEPTCKFCKKEQEREHKNNETVVEESTEERLEQPAESEPAS